MAAAGKFQSTHPRGVRHRDRAGVGGGQWSFIPRTRVGCDQIMDDWVTYQDAFQSTHPRGVRRQPIGGGAVAQAVSIHAPAWGATQIEFVGIDFQTGFNPRTRVGCDSVVDGVMDRVPVFQSTHPRGVRLYQGDMHDPSENRFNPRTRVGCDGLARVEYPAVDGVSIHAPAWGATRPRWRP